MNTKFMFIVLGIIVLAGLVISNPDKPVSEFFLTLLLGVGLFIIPIFILFRIFKYKNKRKCEKCQRILGANCAKEGWNCPYNN